GCAPAATAQWPPRRRNRWRCDRTAGLPARRRTSSESGSRPWRRNSCNRGRRQDRDPDRTAPPPPTGWSEPQDRSRTCVHPSCQRLDYACGLLYRQRCKAVTTGARSRTTWSGLVEGTFNASVSEAAMRMRPGRATSRPRGLNAYSASGDEAPVRRSRRSSISRQPPGNHMDSSLKQDTRLGQLTTPLGKDVLVLVRLDATEGLSELFEYQIEALSAKEVDVD